MYLVPSTDDVQGTFKRGRTLQVGDESGVLTGSTLTVAAARVFKGGLIVRFEDVSDRNVAEQFRGRTLLIPAEEARPLEGDEYFVHDLVGMEVGLPEGETVGVVVEVYEGGPSLILGVEGSGGERLIPFTRQVVLEVDVDARRIVIDPIPGLLTL